MKIIIDFIKSFLYYPTLCKWLNDNNYEFFKDSRLQYAIKHCRMKNLTEKTEEYSYPNCWICQYKQEPILKTEKQTD